MTSHVPASPQVPPAATPAVLAPRRRGAVTGATAVTLLVLGLVALYLFRLSNVPRQADISTKPPSRVGAASQSPMVGAGAEDDDAAVRRIVAAYARAIQSKDFEAFKSLRPNLSGVEQRQLADSFKAVNSQRIEITVLSVEHRASNALVKVRRRETLTVGGHVQTSDSEQTMKLIRSSAGWIIAEIVR